MEVQELVGALFNIALVVMIVATMVSAGFTTTFANLGAVLSRVGLVVLVLVTGLVIRPLVGWGTAELFNFVRAGLYSDGPYCGGSRRPARCQVRHGRQGRRHDWWRPSRSCSLSWHHSRLRRPPTSFSKQRISAREFRCPFGDLLKTIVFLQVLPFVVGLLIRHWNEKSATRVERVRREDHRPILHGRCGVGSAVELADDHRSPRRPGPGRPASSSRLS